MRQSLKFGKEKRSEGSRGKEERKQGGRRLGVGIMTGIRRHKKTTLIKVAFSFFQQILLLGLRLGRRSFFAGRSCLLGRRRSAAARLCSLGTVNLFDCHVPELFVLTKRATGILPVVISSFSD
jgi:hypothetical protein